MLISIESPLRKEHDMLVQAYKALKSVWHHPLCRGHHAKLLTRFVRWHVAGRLGPGDIAVPWVNGVRFLALPWHYSLSANVYCGLLEYYEMSFILHFLRTEDLFIDVGANRGSYTLLAGGAIGARVMAFEPVPETFKALQANVRLNNLGKHVQCFHAGLGEQEKPLFFTAEPSDCVNHVLSSEDSAKPSISVPVYRLDQRVGNQVPTLMKIDVEGYEYQVLQGASCILSQPALQAVILEMGSTNSQRYGYTSEDIHGRMNDAGFQPMTYDPVRRELTEAASWSDRLSLNTLYIRNPQNVRKRLATAAPYSVLGRSV